MLHRVHGRGWGIQKPRDTKKGATLLENVFAKCQVPLGGMVSS
jgi:hypothetical protein